MLVLISSVSFTILHREMGDELFEQYAKQTIYLAEHTEEEDADVVQPLYDFVLKHIDWSEDEMVQKYLENIE